MSNLKITKETLMSGINVKQGDPAPVAEYPKTRLVYMFIHDEREGRIYKSDRFGLVIVFDGILKIGGDFLIVDIETREKLKGEELANLVELLVSVISESIPRD